MLVKWTYFCRKRLKQRQFAIEKIQAQPVSPPELFSWEEKFGPDWSNESIPLDKFIGKRNIQCINCSVTRKIAKCLYKLPKTISLEKWYILTPLQKLPKNVGTLGKLIVAEDFKKFPQSGHIDQLPQLIFATTLWICQLGQKVYSVDSISKSNLLQHLRRKGNFESLNLVECFIGILLV